MSTEPQDATEVRASRSRIGRVQAALGLNKPFKIWFVGNHLLVLLFLAFLLGLTAPDPGRAVSKPAIDLGEQFGTMRLVQFINVALIFLISGLRLKTDAMMKALKHPIGLLSGWFSILAWTPLLGFITARLPLEPKEFSIGLTLFCCVPTTLTSGAALVTGCKGASRASELAILVTVSTNLFGCFTSPVWLSATLSGLDADIDIITLLAKLCLSLLLPMIIGKVAQWFIPNVAKLSKDWKISLTIFSNFNLVFIIWQSVSRASRTIFEAGAGNVCACIACGVCLHVIFWLANCPLLLFAKIEDVHQRRAVFLLGSQKTLPVALAIIASLPDGAIGSPSLMTLPCIFGHLSQLIIDAFLVNHWAKLPSENSDESKTVGNRVAVEPGDVAENNGATEIQDGTEDNAAGPVP